LWVGRGVENRRGAQGVPWVELWQLGAREAIAGLGKVIDVQGRGAGRIVLSNAGLEALGSHGKPALGKHALNGLLEAMRMVLATGQAQTGTQGLDALEVDLLIEERGNAQDGHALGECLVDGAVAAVGDRDIGDAHQRVAIGQLLDKDIVVAAVQIDGQAGGGDQDLVLGAAKHAHSLCEKLGVTGAPHREIQRGAVAIEAWQPDGTGQRGAKQDGPYVAKVGGTVGMHGEVFGQIRQQGDIALYELVEGGERGQTEPLAHGIEALGPVANDEPHERWKQGTAQALAEDALGDVALGELNALGKTAGPRGIGEADTGNAQGGGAGGQGQAHVSDHDVGRDGGDGFHVGGDGLFGDLLPPAHVDQACFAGQGEGDFAVFGVDRMDRKPCFPHQAGIGAGGAKDDLVALVLLQGATHL
jgi:hypothetical protein